MIAPQIHPQAAERARAIRLVVFDIDGTLTDGRLYIGAQGESCKAFSVHDGFGLVMLRQAGITVAILTGRRSQIVAARAAELQITEVLQGVANKDEALRGLCTRLRIGLHETAMMGDDWPDLPAMSIAGLAVTVAQACAEVRARAHWISSRPAGEGAAREFAQWLLEQQHKLAPLRERFLHGMAPAERSADVPEGAGSRMPAGS